MTYFLKKGGCFFPTSEEALDLHNPLPPDNYVLKYEMNAGFFFEPISLFNLPSKVYGNYFNDADRILNTFLSRKNTTGVLLAGEKGGGKTLLAKITSNKAIEMGIPTIVVSSAFTGNEFNTCVQNIEQRAILMFDEFEKVYEPDKQEQILTLLDGVFNSDKLFIFTCNNKYKLDYNLRNRPGRIFYMMEFAGVTEEFIREYCEDRLNDKSQTESICKLSMLFDKFNFDMLQSVVEEMNRYAESVHDALRMLNVKPDQQAHSRYTAELWVDGEKVDKNLLYDEGDWSGQILGNPVSILYYEDEEEKERDDLTSVIFEPFELVKIDHKKGTYTLKNDGAEAVLTRVQAREFDYGKLF